MKLSPSNQNQQSLKRISTTRTCLAVTFLKVQGKTVEATILSLNSTTGAAKDIYPVTLPGLHVGCSRVHHHDHLRVLPSSAKENITCTSHQNYDDPGRWEPTDLKKQRIEFVTSVKLELG